MKNRRRWITIGLVAALGSLGSFYLFGLVFAQRLLWIEHANPTADAIVLLGGDRLYRPSRAVELYRSGAAPHIIVTGNGDCEEVKHALCLQGVPSDAVETECASRSTSQNARFTIPTLRARGAKRVILVTSWFHSRRALLCFRHYAPDIEFISFPTREDLPRNHWPLNRERSWVLLEYPKFVWYWVRYGIAPF